MTKTFKSKLGWEIIIPVALILTILGVIMIINNAWPWFILILVVKISLAHLFLTTSYTIMGEKLIIKSGFFYTLNLKIHSIKKINKTGNCMTSPATSLDRIEIVYGDYDIVMVSPKDKEGFIKCLLEINPNIAIEMEIKE